MRNRQIIGVSTSKITKEETVTLILTDKQLQQVCDFSNLVKLSQGGGGEEGGGGGWRRGHYRVSIFWAQNIFRIFDLQGRLIYHFKLRHQNYLAH